MTREEIVEELENAIGLIKQDGKDWLDERDIPLLESIIKAIKIEPYEDTISRQAVLDAFWKLDIELRPNAINAILNMVNNIPSSVNPQELKTDWIPVSERLPNFAGTYLVTRYSPSNAMNPTYFVDACFFDGTSTWHNDNYMNHERAYLTNVVAWLEEPEPYKHQKHGDGKEKKP